MFRRLSIIAPLFSMFLVPCRAQTSAVPSTTPDQSQTGSSANVDPSPKNPSSKKVWTNENLSEASGKVSVVGDKRNQKYTVTPAKPADPATVSRIRQNLQKLQSQLDEVNLELTSFKRIPGRRNGNEEFQ